MSEITNLQNREQGDELIQIKDFLYLCLAKWRWFVLLLVVVIGLAVVYLLRTPSSYVMSTEVLIKEDGRTQSIGSDVAQMFSNMGMSAGRTNLVNEARAMQSSATLLETGKRLNLDVNYRIDGRFHKKTLYGTTLPVQVSFPDLGDGESATMTVRLLDGERVELSRFTRKKDKFSGSVSARLNDTITTPLGRVVVEQTPCYEEYMSEEPHLIYISRSSVYAMTTAISKRLNVAADEKSRGTVIDLSYTDIIPQRAEDVLNTLLTVYRENWMLDKNQMTVATSMFITNRLGIIERELGSVDEDIASYKSENRLPNVEAASELYMVQSQETANKILALNTQLSMVRYIHEELTGNSKKNDLLPVNSGVESVDIERQISEYNTLQLQRNNLVSNSSERNPLVVDMDQSLAAIRAAIVTSVENLEVTLGTQIADLQRNDQKIANQIATSPNQAKYLLTVGRQQKIKEALYLFLLQKREENELSRTFTAYNMRVLTPPSGTMLPVAPKANMILFAALLLALIIPAVVIFALESMNTKVRGRKDLEGVSVPFIGEIPLLISGKKKGLRGRKPQEERRIVVEGNKRDIINEAFRVLRTNLEFMVGKNPSAVIAITSFNPGSGKSFITMNLGMSLAINGKRVLVIDGDMRHGTASAYVGSPAKGLSDYLNGHIDNPEQVIVRDPAQGHLDVMPVGTIPPNPTELLFSDRLKELIAFAKERYEFVLIDCPPIEIVADADIIEKLSDRTIFVLRAGLLERSMLPELDKIYASGKYTNMSMILNGTAGGGGRYGHRYGYRYGYHYGYGQGYHYGSDEKKKKK
jgi:capsular exopolysaccharide synthesis family protein